MTCERVCCAWHPCCGCCERSAVPRCCFFRQMHPSVDGVRAIMLLLEMHLHLLHKHVMVMVGGIATHLVAVLQRRAAVTPTPENTVDPELLDRVELYKQV